MNSLRPDYTAVVIGASGGIGEAVSNALEADLRCSRVYSLSRLDGGLDLTDAQSVRQAAVDIGERVGAVDMIFDASGVLTIDGHGPEKSLGHLNAERMAQAFAINAIGPALLLKHFVPLLPRSGRSVFATLSARVGSIGDNHLGGWMSYRASKAALNQIVRCAAIEIAQKRPDALCVALHPGTVESNLSAPYARTFTFSREDCAARLLRVLDHLGPRHSGGFFDYDGREITW